MPWSKVYNDVLRAIRNMGDSGLFFRGHCTSSWTLLPSLARLGPAAVPKLGFERLEDLEDNLYFDFTTRAGDLLPRTNDSWDNFFTMQHHGVPTRLLDWTDTFSVALYFALQNPAPEVAIWILQPDELNDRTMNRRQLLNPWELSGSYADYFIARSKRLEGAVVSITPLRHHRRMLQQRAGFTLHDDLKMPLEELHPDVVTKIVLPLDTHAGARDFLRMAGVDEFALFPDLDGLARELVAAYFKRFVVP